jgi:hypothetical protein
MSLCSRPSADGRTVKRYGAGKHVPRLMLLLESEVGRFVLVAWNSSMVPATLGEELNFQIFAC